MSGGGNAARQPAFLTLEQMAERMTSNAGSVAKAAERLRAQLIGSVPKGEASAGPTFPTAGALGDIASMVQRTTYLVEDAIADLEAIINEFPPVDKKPAPIKEDRIR